MSSIDSGEGGALGAAGSTVLLQDVFQEMLVKILQSCLDFLKWGCMRYLSIVCVFPTVDGDLHAPSTEKQQE